MKIKIFLSAIFIWSHLISFAQIDSIEITDLYVPNAPGFVLADKSPSSIEKPTSIRAFGISLINLREGGAVETTPFWLMNHRNYTFDDYVKNKVPFFETLNISVATFKTDSTSSLSFGVRSQLLRFYSKSMLDKKQEIVDLLSDEDISEDDLRKIDIAKKQLDSIRQKPVFNFEVAAAIIGSSNNNSYKNLASNKSGVWANIRFSPNKVPIDIVGLTRYSWANNTSPKFGSDSSFLDFGLALSYQKKNIDFSLEYINRHDFSINKNSDRLAFVLNYLLADNIILVGSLGKNFNEVDNILAVFGAKFGVSKKKLKL